MDFDQHELLALVAPRLLCVASATDDHWAGPQGEWWAAKFASPAWELYGKKGLAADAYPAPETPQQDGYISYHVRKGGHFLAPYDWHRYMDFADRHGWRSTAKRMVLSDESRGLVHYYDSSDPSKCFSVPAEKTTWDIQPVGKRAPGKIGRYRYVCRSGFKVVDMDERRDVDEFRHPSLAGISAISELPGGGFIACVNPRVKKGVKVILVRKFSRERELLATYSFPGIFNARTMTLLPDGEILLAHETGFTRARLPEENRDQDGIVIKHVKMPHGRNMYHAVPALDGKGYWTGAGYAAEVVRFDNDGNPQKVWAIPPADGKKGYFFAKVQEFANGHVLVANWTGHRSDDSRRGWQLIEFDQNGKVAWSLYDPATFGSIHGFVVLE